MATPVPTEAALKTNLTFDLPSILYLLSCRSLYRQTKKFKQTITLTPHAPIASFSNRVFTSFKLFLYVPEIYKQNIEPLDWMIIFWRIGLRRSANLPEIGLKKNSQCNAIPLLGMYILF